MGCCQLRRDRVQIIVNPFVLETNITGCQLEFVKKKKKKKKKGFFKRFNFQKERFLMPEKRFFLLRAYLNKNSKR